VYDLVFKNARITDGTGNPWIKADLAVTNGKIAAIKKNNLEDAQRTIDAHGLVIAPGFIDLHTHTDRAILTNNKATSSIMAGVTMEAIGNCGSAMYGFTHDQIESFQKRMPDIKINWTDLKGYRETLEKKGIGINLVPFFGHNTIRTSVMGEEGKGGERTKPTTEEMRRMRELALDLMDQGAFGMTTGLWYPPGRNALTKEIIDLCKIVANKGGVYMSHIRGEAGVLIESVNEFVEICEKADIRGSLSHHKAMQEWNWGKPNETIRILKKARERGVEIICDQYPWEYSSSANLGRWFISGWGRNSGREGHYNPHNLTLEILLRDLKDPVMWLRIKKEAKERFNLEVKENNKRSNLLIKHGIIPSEIVDPRSFEYITYSKTHPELEGKRFYEVVDTLGMNDYWEAIRKVLLDDEGNTYTGGGGMCEEDIKTILSFPACSVSTDGETRDKPSSVLKPAHPRAYGTFAKILQKYVRETKVLTLEDAIRKMTSLPASFLGLSDRGVIRIGAWADLTIFDPDKVENKATYAKPDAFPVGIQYVIVNGEIAQETGKRSDKLSGKVLINKLPK
jgi:N-acyl-D-amino-acid deacylase